MTIKVMVCIPSLNTWEADFGMSLAFMVNFCTKNSVVRNKHLHVQLHNHKGSILAQSRQRMVDIAVKGGATHVLFVDTDQTFPPDTLHRLLLANKKVVACNIATKMLPSSGTARFKDGTILRTEESDVGLIKVWRVGTGVMLIDLAVFKRKGMQRPYFSQYWSKDLDAYVGEDWAFCEMVESSGCSIYVEQRLSYEIGHLGKLNYTHDIVNAGVEHEEDATEEKSAQG